MKVAILGAGNIGGTLARRLARSGHEVTIGVRDPASPRAREAAGSVRVATTAQAVDKTDAVIFAVPGAAVEELIAEIGPSLAGKIVIDATNNMSGGGSLNSVAFIADHTAGTAVYRAFNTLGWENFAEPMFGDVQADLFYCGPEGAGRPAVEDIIHAVGLRPVYVGGPEQADVVDSVASLWFALVSGQKHSRRLAFKVLED
ncbi:MAG: NAD(P)-binding domain-containing protein [Chloroflexi bacterium]|nr:NAD(P)-binding domain-containing protein [Chloroflexota bacterium]